MLQIGGKQMWIGHTIHWVLEAVQVREMVVPWTRVGGGDREQMICMNYLGERTKKICIGGAFI